MQGQSAGNKRAKPHRGQLLERCLCVGIGDRRAAKDAVFSSEHANKRALGISRGGEKALKNDLLVACQQTAIMTQHVGHKRQMNGNKVDLVFLDLGFLLRKSRRIVGSFEREEILHARKARLNLVDLHFFLFCGFFFLPWRMVRFR